MIRFNKYLLILDIIALYIIAKLSILLTPYDSLGGKLLSEQFKYIIYSILSYLLLFNILDYSNTINRNFVKTIKVTILLVALHSIIIIVYFYIVEYQIIGRYISISYVIILSIYLLLSRSILQKLDTNQLRNHVVFANKYEREVINNIFNKKSLNKKFQFANEIKKDKITSKIILYTPSQEHKINKELMERNKYCINFYDYVLNKYMFVFIDFANEITFVNLRDKNRKFDSIKYAIDKVIGLGGFLLLIPIYLIISVISIYTIGFPLFYKQKRVGQNCKLFTIYKFRTMKNNSELDGAVWAKENDLRITKFGKILRKTRLDETPQFLNILKGDMSFIGPRPERPEFVKDLGANINLYDYRHMVKPGLTGWAQINYPYGASEEDSKNKLAYDLYYILKKNIILEIFILLRTFGAIMKGSR